MNTEARTPAGWYVTSSKPGTPTEYYQEAKTGARARVERVRHGPREWIHLVVQGPDGHRLSWDRATTVARAFLAGLDFVALCPDPRRSDEVHVFVAPERGPALSDHGCQATVDAALSERDAALAKLEQLQTRIDELTGEARAEQYAKDIEEIEASECYRYLYRAALLVSNRERRRLRLLIDGLKTLLDETGHLPDCPAGSQHQRRIRSYERFVEDARKLEQCGRASSSLVAEAEESLREEIQVGPTRCAPECRTIREILR